MKSYCPDFKIMYLGIFFLGFFGLAKSSWATTYYVDYDNGTDNNNGAAMTAPWKHAPGASDATGNAGSTTLAAGDIVYLKGGVKYRGALITVNSSGSSIATGSRGIIISGGVLTDSDGSFASVEAGQYIYIYHSKPSMADTWVESAGLFHVASKDIGSQITLSDFNGVAHSTGEMTYKVFNPIVFTTKSGWGTGKAIFDGENTRNRVFETNGKSYLSFENMSFVNIPHIGEDNDDGVIRNSTGTANYVRVYNCDWTATSSAGNISINSNGSNYWIIQNCTFTSQYYGSTSVGVYKYSLIENNDFNASCRGIGGIGAYSVIRYNTFRNYQGCSGASHSDAIGPLQTILISGDTNYWWLYGNDFYHNMQDLFLTDSNNTLLPYENRYSVIHSNVFHGMFGASGPCEDTQDMSIFIIDSSDILIANNTWGSLDTCSHYWMQLGYGGNWNSFAGNMNITLENNLFSGGGLTIR